MLGSREVLLSLTSGFVNGGRAVYAEFMILHNKSLQPEMLKARLVKKFGAEDRSALEESPLFESGKWDNKVFYATKKPKYRLFAVASLDDELQVSVEPIKGNLVETCESVWRGMKRALKAKWALKARKPKLNLLKLVDDGSMDDIMKARTCTFGTELGRSENISPVIVGVVAAIYALIGFYTFASKDRGEFLAGAVSGVAAALVALFLAFLATRKGKLSWEVVSLL